MCFLMSLRRTVYVVSKLPERGGGLKIQSDHFLNKTAFHLKKVCYKVSSCENCQQHSYKAFTGLSNRAQMVGGGRPLKSKLCA